MIPPKRESVVKALEEGPDRLCLAYSVEHAGYWGPQWTPIVKERLNAGIFTVREVAAAGGGLEVEILEGVKMDAVTLLGDHLVALLRQSPTNPTVRSQVHSAIKIPLPDDKTDYESIMEWIHPTSMKQVQCGASPGALKYEAQYTECVSGRCDYSYTRSGVGYYEVSVETMNGLMDGASNFSSFFSEVTREAKRVVKAEPPALHSHGETDYDNHEDDDETCDNSVQFDNLEPLLKDWLLRNHPNVYGKWLF